MANIPITATSVKSSVTSKGQTFICSVAITAGEVVFRDPTNANNVTLTVANNTALLPQEAQGQVWIALGSGGVGQPISVLTEDDPFLTIGTHGETIGAVYFVSRTPGGLCLNSDLATGDYVMPCLVIVDATHVNWSPSTGVTAPHP